MSNQQPGGSSRSNPLPAIIIAIVVGGLAVWLVTRTTAQKEEEQKQNLQLKRPPGAPADPLVEKIPEIGGGMERAKSVCEDQARAAIQKERERRITRRQLDKGRDLYREAKSRYDDCITDLVLSMERGFGRADLPRATEKLEAANNAMMTFSGWYASLEKPRVGASGPLGESLDAFRQMQNDSTAENWKAIDRLKGILEKCRLTPWDDLAGRR